MHAVPPCPAIRNLLEDWADHRLSHREEERVRDHLASCEDCREAAMERDPSALFLALRGQSQTEFFWAGLWRDIQDEVADMEPPATRRRHALAWFASAAAILLTVGLMAVLAVSLPWSGPSLADGSHAPPETPEAGLARNLDPEAPVRMEAAARPPGPKADSPSLQRVIPDSPEARIVTYEAATPIVIVYDDKIDL